MQDWRLFMSTVIDTIRKIKADKEQRNVMPTYSLRTELLHEGCTIEEIRSSVVSGKVKFGRTINDWYFYEKTND